MRLTEPCRLWVELFEQSFQRLDRKVLDLDIANQSMVYT